jgi:type 1 glutamine amidotransferase
VGAGEVLYLNLGHCRGHYDMQPMIDYYPDIERGSWAKPQYYELLRRGIRYCAAKACVAA